MSCNVLEYYCIVLKYYYTINTIDIDIRMMITIILKIVQHQYDFSSSVVPGIRLSTPSMLPYDDTMIPLYC